jgi:hypothetical protein
MPMPSRRAARSVLPLALLLAAARVEAQNVVTEVGTPHVSSQPTASFATTGALMNGMIVTATIGDVVSSGVWGLLGGVLSGVQTSQFVVFHDSFVATGSDMTWSLSNLSFDRPLTRLRFEGAPGLTVFDLDIGPGGGAIGTPGSSTGVHLTLPFPLAANATVTYRNQVAVLGSPPVGDLYEEVELVLGTGLAPRTRIFFAMDTDNLPANATIVPGGSVVPEPATLALLATGLLVTAAVGRRRRRRAD